ncbi:MAG: hypothetical protein IJ867_06305 [Clostridia bacterium]|nr:hypothetical protein [Clostridia bacterium]
MRKTKEKRGITLIALIITIIVLLILAGISISAVVGDNGIVSQAIRAKEETEEAKRKEELQLEEAAERMAGRILGPKEGGSYDNPYIPSGFTHTIGDGEWNNGYTIKDEIGNEFVWVPCEMPENIGSNSEVVVLKKTLPTRKEDGTIDSTDKYFRYNHNNRKLLPIDVSDNIEAEDESVEKIENSVKLYGGFYISKYEAGVPLKEDGTKETKSNYEFYTESENDSNALLATDGSIKPISQPGVGVWNYISRIDAITVASSMINTTDGVKSSLISAECWDTTLQWMVTTSDNRENNNGYDIDSRNRGYYKQESGYTDLDGYKGHVTGYYSVNNIYDMAGNVYELTTENSIGSDGALRVIFRGGGYHVSGKNDSAAVRALNREDYVSERLGFRIVLYK